MPMLSNYHWDCSEPAPRNDSAVANKSSPCFGTSSFPPAGGSNTGERPLKDVKTNDRINERLKSAFSKHGLLFNPYLIFSLFSFPFTCFVQVTLLGISNPTRVRANYLTSLEDADFLTGAHRDDTEIGTFDEGVDSDFSRVDEWV
jgi:hypothetical protein